MHPGRHTLHMPTVSSDWSMEMLKSDWIKEYDRNTNESKPAIKVLKYTRSYKKSHACDDLLMQIQQTFSTFKLPKLCVHACIYVLHL